MKGGDAMLVSEIIKKVVDERAACLIRYRKPIENPYQYDVKGLFTGKKSGWLVIDLFTANAMFTVFNALNECHRAKFDSIPFQKLVDFTWKNVK